MIERIRRVVAAFRQLTPHQIGIVLAIGIIGGLFPVPGKISTLLYFQSSIF